MQFRCRFHNATLSLASARLRLLIIIAFPFLIAFPPAAGAKIYIDITSPGKLVSTAVQEFDGPAGKEIAEIIKSDLDFSGFFLVLEDDLYIEKPGQAFDRANWAPIGAELVLKGSVKNADGKITVSARLYDVNETGAVFSKDYRADKDLTRAIAHTISNDIYRAITGQEGVFRTKVAFLSKDGGKQRLAIMDWDGYGVKKLGVSGSSLLSPHWSDDGTMLLYSAEKNRQWGVYVLDFKKMEERLVVNVKGTSIAGDFFPGGEEFALSSSSEGTPDIFTYNIKSAKLNRLTSDRGIEVSPAVSPDGGAIAFVSDRGGSPQIYSIDRMGYNIKRITFEGAYNTSPCWSPKGDVIAFSGRYEGKNQIFTVRPDGTGLTLLTKAGNNEEPSFSPDGRHIVFTSDREGKKGIYVIRADGEAERRVSPKGAEASSPRWSPR